MMKGTFDMFLNYAGLAHNVQVPGSLFGIDVWKGH